MGTVRISGSVCKHYKNRIQRSMWITKFVLLLTISCYSIGIIQADSIEIPPILVGNTRSQSIVGIENGVVSEFLTGLDNPDHMRIVDNFLYVTVGDSMETSTMLRMNVQTGHIDANFLKGGDLLRPYGFDFYKGRIYVSSFRTDKIVVYEMGTGNYIGVFAQGNGTAEGLCNGPNHIAIYDDKLYLTTQGSEAVDGSPVYKFPSQIVVYDMHTGSGSIFVQQPTPSPDGLGFVSMLGIQVFCLAECYVYTTDFAGGLRVYDLEDGALVYEVSTSYEPGSTTTGGLSIQDGEIYIPAFVDATSGGVVLRFEATTGSPLPSMGQAGAIFAAPSDLLVRPIGILASGGRSKSKGSKGGTTKSKRSNKSGMSKGKRER